MITRTHLDFLFIVGSDYLAPSSRTMLLGVALLVTLQTDFISLVLALITNIVVLFIQL